MENIEQAAPGIPKIEVTLAIDRNGVLNVSALDVSTGSQKSIIITNNKGRLNQEEIKKMMVEAEELREEDQKMKDDTMARSDLEEYCIETECKADKKQASNGITEEEYNQICEACDEVLFWLDDNQEATRSEVKLQKRSKHMKTFVHLFSNKELLLL